MKRGRRTGVLLSLATTLAMLAACNLLTGLDKEYALPNGSPPAGEGGAVDGARPEEDAGTSDAAVDARTDAVVPPTRFCETQDAGASSGFCWDFESPASAPSWGWNDSSLVGGELEVGDGLGMNGSRALRAKVTDATPSAKLYLHHRLAGPLTTFRHVELSFSFMVKTRTTQLYIAALGIIGADEGTANAYTGLASYVGGFDVSDPPGSLVAPTALAALNTWIRATIVLDRAATTVPFIQKITVTKAGGAAEEVDTRSFTPQSLDGFTHISVGAFFTSREAGGAIETVIDDVLVRRW